MAKEPSPKKIKKLVSGMKVGEAVRRLSLPEKKGSDE